LSKQYFELAIKPQKEYELFLDLVEEITADAIEETGGFIIIRSEDNLDDFVEAIKKFSEALQVKCKISYEKKDSINWIKKYQNSIKPIEIGSFYIRPSWEDKKDNKIDIIINPALAFGSGHHETTSSCIEAIDEFVKSSDTLLDVGTGSGILAIAGSKKGAIVDICDTDEICIDSTKSNFELNKEKFNQFWIGSASKATKKYAVVVANIVADVLVISANDLKKCLKNNSILILSGILDKHKNRVLNKFNDLKELKIIQKNEWLTIVLKSSKEF